MSIEIGGKCPLCGEGVLNEGRRIRYILKDKKRVYFKTRTCICSVCKQTVTTAGQFKKNLVILESLERE